MPIFKKVNSDSSIMLETHRQALRQCRTILVRDLNVMHILEHMSTDDVFRQESRDAILSCPTREQRVNTFLDHLETSGEKAFSLFMESLKSYYRHLYVHVEESVKTTVNWTDVERRERVSFDGETVRKFLMRRRRELSQANENKENGGDGGECRDETNEYVNCFSVTSRGFLQKEKWIQHTNELKKITGEEEEKTYMGVVCTNLVCKQIDWSTVKNADDIKKPPNRNAPSYVFEKECSYARSPFGTLLSKRSSHDAGDGSTLGHRKRDRSKFDNEEGKTESCFPLSSNVRTSHSPPPVPPKPDNLPVLGGIGGPPVVKPRSVFGGIDVHPPPRTTSKICLPDDSNVKPPVPNHKPSTRLPHSQSAHSALNTKKNSAPPPRFQTLPCESVVNHARGNACNRYSTGLDGSLNNAESDAISLDYNISVSSTADLDCDKDGRKIEDGDGDGDGGGGQTRQELEHAENDANEVFYGENGTEKDSNDENLGSLEDVCDNGELEEGHEYEEEETREAMVRYDLPPVESVEIGVNATKEPALPQLSVEQQNLADDEFSSDNSYYEEIGMLVDEHHSLSGRSGATYLDPSLSLLRKKYGSAMRGVPYRYTFDELKKSSRKLILRNTFLLVDVEPAYVPSVSSVDCKIDAENEESPEPNLFRETVLTFDREGIAFYLPKHVLRKHGEPDGEPWFYPMSMTTRQASFFLSSVKQEGCFVVYRPHASTSSAAAFVLSVCLANGDVVHYRINESIYGDVRIEGHDHTFLTILELIDYFRKNKSSLAVRLRRPLKYARFPITPGYHYELRYELVRDDLNLTGNIIGQGNFGVVCSGLYQNISVAVKVLQTSEASTAVDEDDFIEEAFSMMGLRHENIVRLVGVSCKAKPFFLVTEYMSKGNLKDCLRNSLVASDNADTLFDVCIQVVSAMRYLESLHFMLHRDLAARNFLVDDQLRIKLADFGRARHVVDDYYQAPRTEKICIKWASPEVLVNSHYSTKSDVWATGVVFWEVFSAGDRPYALLSGEQTALYVTEGGRLDKPPLCPPDLFHVMMSCWCDDPDDRPSFVDLSDALKNKSILYYPRPSAEASDYRLPIALPFKSKTKPGTTATNGGPNNRRKSTFRDKRTNVVSDPPPPPTNEFISNGKDVSKQRLSYGDHHMPKFLSEISITSASSELLDVEREEVSRGDKIRQSLRKFINKKSKTKMNDIASKYGHVSQEFPIMY